MLCLIQRFKIKGGNTSDEETVYKTLTGLHGCSICCNHGCTVCASDDFNKIGVAGKDAKGVVPVGIRPEILEKTLASTAIDKVRPHITIILLVRYPYPYNCSTALPCGNGKCAVTHDGQPFPNVMDRDMRFFSVIGSMEMIKLRKLLKESCSCKIRCDQAGFLI